jgi:hypothetical protein
MGNPDSPSPFFRRSSLRIRTIHFAPDGRTQRPIREQYPTLPRRLFRHGVLATTQTVREGVTWPLSIFVSSALRAPESELATVIRLSKGRHYRLTSNMVDWKTRTLDIPRTQNLEAVDLPLNNAFVGL